MKPRDSAIPARPASRRVWARHRSLLFMCVPAIAYFVIFHYIPMYGLVIAFKDFRVSEGVMGSDWNGLENFRRLFTGPSFLQALRNTVVISFLRLIVGFFAPVVLALLLNEMRIAWFRRGVQTLTYLPYFFSWVILGGIFRMLLASDGPINVLIVSLGMEPIPFLTHPGWFILVIIISGIWQSVGWGAVIYLAALSSIPQHLYEAATVDGAGRWKQTLHITLPALVPTMAVLFILSLGHVLNAGFDQIYNLYGPAVFSTSDILDTYMLRQLQAMDFAEGTATGLFKSVIGMVLIVAVNTMANRMSDGEHGLF